MFNSNKIIAICKINVLFLQISSMVPDSVTTHSKTHLLRIKKQGEDYILMSARYFSARGTYSLPGYRFINLLNSSAAISFFPILK